MEPGNLESFKYKNNTFNNGDGQKINNQMSSGQGKHTVSNIKRGIRLRSGDTGRVMESKLKAVSLPIPVTGPKEARVRKLPNALNFLFNKGGFAQRNILENSDEIGRYVFVTDFVGSEHYHQYEEQDFHAAFQNKVTLEGYEFILKTISNRLAVTCSPDGSSSITQQSIEPVEENVPTPATEQKMEVDPVIESASEKNKKSGKKKKNKANGNAAESESKTELSQDLDDSSKMEDEDDEEGWSNKKGKKQNNQDKNTKADQQAKSSNKKSESESMDTTESSKNDTNNAENKDRSSTKPAESKKLKTEKGASESLSKETVTRGDRKKSVEKEKLDPKSEKKIERMLNYCLNLSGAVEKGVAKKRDGSVLLSELLEKCNGTEFGEDVVIDLIQSTLSAQYTVWMESNQYRVQSIVKKVTPEAENKDTATRQGEAAGGATGGAGWNDQRRGDRNNYDRRGPNQRRPRESEDDIYLSKTMAYLLRHGAQKHKLHMGQDGFMLVKDLLAYPDFQNYYGEEDVKRVVENNDKKRFQLDHSESGELIVRANQGHTVQVESLNLLPVTDPIMIPVVIHGTSLASWNIIKKEGLSRMKRNHIHFSKGEPGDNEVISGMRSSCEVMIYINAAKAMQDGFQFFISANDVILCAGNESGILPPQYFGDVIQRRPQRMKLQ